MNDTSKLSLAIFGAAVVLVAGYVGYAEFVRARDIDAAQQAMASLSDQAQRASDSGRRLLWQSQQLDPRVVADAPERVRRLRAPQPLAADQRCAGGVVVQVQGTVYTQLGLRCSGGYIVPPPTSPMQ